LFVGTLFRSPMGWFELSYTSEYLRECFRIYKTFDNIKAIITLANIALLYGKHTDPNDCLIFL
jgi:hypothetical protein